MIRKIIAIISGLAATIAAVGIISPALPLILPSISSFIGGLVAGFIMRRKGVVYGGLVSVVIFIALTYSLISIAYEHNGGKYVYPAVMVLAPNLIAIALGSLGGYLGERLSSKKTK